jgi:dedicator of cytokinesis protein 3
MPGDERNDLFVTIGRAEFDKGAKNAGRNVEVEMSVVLEDGSVVANALSLGMGEAPLSQYLSTIYYHNNSPQWNETVRVEISRDLYDKAHLRFYFRHCSSKDVREKHAIFAFTFLPLQQFEAGVRTDVTVKVCSGLLVPVV